MKICCSSTVPSSQCILIAVCVAFQYCTYCNIYSNCYVMVLKYCQHFHNIFIMLLGLSILLHLVFVYGDLALSTSYNCLTALQNFIIYQQLLLELVLWHCSRNPLFIWCEIRLLCQHLSYERNIAFSNIFWELKNYLS